MFSFTKQQQPRKKLGINCLDLFCERKRNKFDIEKRNDMKSKRGRRKHLC